MSNVIRSSYIQYLLKSVYECLLVALEVRFCVFRERERVILEIRKNTNKEIILLELKFICLLEREREIAQPYRFIIKKSMVNLFIELEIIFFSILLKLECMLHLLFSCIL